jgi:hypothetical protein
MAMKAAFSMPIDSKWVKTRLSTESNGSDRFLDPNDSKRAQVGKAQTFIEERNGAFSGPTL